ncbi:MAG: hypothetical protein M3O70_21985 [Actinomycetota bacterium]|nr:hypothetical protein [Actinomycetota bacterium]
MRDAASRKVEAEDPQRRCRQPPVGGVRWLSTRACGPREDGLAGVGRLVVTAMSDTASWKRPRRAASTSASTYSCASPWEKPKSSRRACPTIRGGIQPGGASLRSGDHPDGRGGSADTHVLAAGAERQTSQTSVLLASTPTNRTRPDPRAGEVDQHLAESATHVEDHTTGGNLEPRPGPPAQFLHRGPVPV